MYKAQLIFKFKTDKGLHKAHSIVNPGFIFYQLRLDELLKKRWAYARKHTINSMLMGAAIKLGGKELKDIAPELKANKVWLEVDYDKSGGGTMTIFITHEDKQRVEDIIEMQTEGLYKNKRDIVIEIVREYD